MTEPTAAVAVIDAGADENVASRSPADRRRVACEDDRSRPKMDPALALAAIGPDTERRSISPASVCAMIGPDSDSSLIVPASSWTRTGSSPGHGDVIADAAGLQGRALAVQDQHARSHPVRSSRGRALEGDMLGDRDRAGATASHIDAASLSVHHENAHPSRYRITVAAMLQGSHADAAASSARTRRLPRPARPPLGGRLSAPTCALLASEDLSSRHRLGSLLAERIACGPAGRQDMSAGSLSGIRPTRWTCVHMGVLNLCTQGWPPAG